MLQFRLVSFVVPVNMYSVPAYSIEFETNFKFEKLENYQITMSVVCALHAIFPFLLLPCPTSILKRKYIKGEDCCHHWVFSYITSSTGTKRINKPFPRFASNWPTCSKESRPGTSKALPTSRRRRWVLSTRPSLVTPNTAT